MALDGLQVEYAPRRPLRVALFSGNYNYTVDGANRALNRLVAHLEQVEGAEVRIYSPTSRTPAFPPTGRLISAPSVSIPFRREYRLALGMSPAIRRDLEAFGPDLIHVSCPDLLGFNALKFARQNRIAAVASLHTLFESYLDFYALGLLKPWVEERLRRFYTACDYVLVPTEVIARQMERDGLAGRTRIWARGVDGELFHPRQRSAAFRAEHGFVDGKPVIVFFGRLVLEKGLALFAETVKRLEASRGPVSVLVIGDGPARTWFEERMPNAVFTGFLTGPALAAALASGDILLNPSATEAFGNVNLEAMASGLALICADAPNTRSMVRPPRTGFLCEARNPAAYAAAIETLLDDPASCSRMGRAAREQSGQYRWPDILASVADVYREAVRRRTLLRGPVPVSISVA